jgi:hypothetical protein
MDERDKSHYNTAMRNMSWAIVISIIFLSSLISLDIIKSNLEILIFVPLVIGGIVNGLTRYKLRIED